MRSKDAERDLAVEGSIWNAEDEILQFGLQDWIAPEDIETHSQVLHEWITAFCALLSSCLLKNCGCSDGSCLTVMTILQEVYV